MEKLQELEDEMEKFFESHRGSAGAGLVLLPGVFQLLSALKVGEIWIWIDKHETAIRFNDNC